MADENILKNVLEMERKSISKLQQQINITSEEKVLELLEQMLQDHKSHFNDVLGKLKELNPQLKEEDVSIVQTAEPDPEAIVSQDELEQELKNNLEETYVEVTEYTGYADEAQDPEIKAMISEFANDEKDHEAKIKELLG